LCGDDAKIYLFADDARLYNILGRDDAVALQSKSDNYTNWSDKWLVKLSTKKCKVMSFHHRQYGMKSNSCTYKILEQVDTYKFLVFGLILYFFLISILAIQLAKLTLCWDLGNKTFENYPGGGGLFCNFVQVLGKTHLGYANTVWALRRICDTKKLKKFKKAT